MRPAPVFLKLLAHALGNQVHRQARSIGRDHRTRFAKRRHPLQQLPLNLQILRHYFNDPIRFRHPLQVILEIPDRHLLCQRRRKKRRGLGLFRGLKSRQHNLVALR